jgi:hypothetical protein
VRLSQPLRRPRAHRDAHPRQEREHFQGFTPVEWKSEDWLSKADPSLKSFLFSLKNPHNFPARKFALKAEKKNYAIYCDSARGPHFCDMGIFSHCNANRDSYSSLGGSYANVIPRDGHTVLTGSYLFTVREIEVFEITG